MYERSLTMLYTSKPFFSLNLVAYCPLSYVMLQASKAEALLSRNQRDQPAHLLIRRGCLPDGGLPGLAFSDGNTWTEIRKFTTLVRICFRWAFYQQLQ